jgi:uncharacterized protein with NRDE domain
MCTLIVLHRVVRGAPLVAAANRDEFRERPAEAPALRITSAGQAVMPLDLRAGGTWLGVNAAGVFAAVTNRRCADPDPGRRSRGWLVVDALAAGSAAEAMERARGLARGAFNPFNLLVADRESAFVITYDESPRALALGPGAHVVGNTPPEAPSAKVERLAKRAGLAAAAPPERVLDALAGICRSHDGDGDARDDACVHAGPYGTRSSTLLLLSDDPAQSALFYAGAAPCEVGYDDFTPLLRALDPPFAASGGRSPRKAS